MQVSFARNAGTATPLHAVRAADLKAWLAKRPKREQAYLKSIAFSAKEGELCLIPDAQGALASAVLGLGKGEDILALATFAEQLPAGTYRFADVPETCGGANGALAWALGTYEFARYKKAKAKGAKLVLPIRRRWRRDRAHRGSDFPRPRSDQHAAQRHGSGRTRRRRARSCEEARREVFRHRRRCADESELSAGPCGGTGLRPRAAPDRSSPGAAPMRRR